MRKEAEEAESTKQSIRDSGYIDCWDSERSDSLSPPHHGREDSFDSLDSFGSRSQQTPSPDVLATRGSSDGHGSDSESDAPPHRRMPDIHKDDMLARRTSISELRTAMPFNQYLPNKSNHSSYVLTPLRKKKSDKEEGGHKSWSTATSPVGGDKPLSTPARSCSEELFHQPSILPGNSTERSAIVSNPVNVSGKHSSEADQGIGVAGALKVTGLAQRTLSESDDAQPSWFGSNLLATISHTDSVSDDPQSMSMSDMHDEDEVVLGPHSQARHELMHNQYNRMKEEEDHWQDDLARWKTRRRSISQDLIKKEEERKMMERLMSGTTSTSQRRKSIKTYREIVEDKERREEELREAYNKARTPEEASAVLQRYAQRFSISETVLERLQLPRLLDRSVSADPTFPLSPFPLSFSNSPTTPEPTNVNPNGPMRYLRQQSAPTPKFTSTLEAQIEEFPKASSSQHRPQIRSRSSDPPSTRALSPISVPLLTPKPSFQFQPTTSESLPSKVDVFYRVNGDVGSDDITPERDRRNSSHFQPSPSITSNRVTDVSTSGPPAPNSTQTSKTTRKPNEAQADSEPISESVQKENGTTLNRPTSLPTELQKQQVSFGCNEPAAATQKKSSIAESITQQTPSTVAKQEQSTSSQVGSQRIQPVTSEISAHSAQERPQRKERELSLTYPGSLGHQPPCETTTEFAKSVRSPLVTSNPKLRWEFFAPSEEMEKDRRGDEKYYREQEKLKEEWEKAQREVAEEERKYHEEERRILEETVAPLTPLSSTLSSPCRGEHCSSSEPHGTIVRSLADWERKQELLERQSRASTESVEWRWRENDRTTDISTADDSMKTARSSLSQNSFQTDMPSQSVQNSQKVSPVSTKTSTSSLKQQDVFDNNKPNRPAGDRRSVSGKKLCSSCGQPLGKGAAMIIETLSLYFHIHCFKCGVCKGQLGDTTTGTDVRIKNGLLNCHQCYIRSRSAGQPTML
ncbi:LIM and calponin homology domains-containing protein 1-like isoform X2 [Thalassophryne amazonica]|uniref:LIM and calponin homology domains-containing protein 1-like isoform X2 n=1 Tax=Thalassophryne amazonica TaxID=390379 RepID=UPI001471C0CB|nr:LIM and calponin homology domains-containing protein 1-like isoform X2 [Thalassophryne amazonica]